MGRVLDFLFPLECLACGAAGALCCDACLAEVLLSSKALRSEGLRAVAAYPYAQPIVRRLIHDLKYEGWTCAAKPLGVLARRWAAKSGAAFCGEDAVLVPVPLSERKARARGFNQAAFLSEALAWALGLRQADRVLVRRRETSPQVSSEDRVRNVAGAFAARLPEGWRGRTFVLVDDVWTTGSTMRECAQALRAAGASDVRGFALAWGNPKADLDAKDERG
jgi:ComF family protein